jgi:hypothetical protein
MKAIVLFIGLYIVALYVGLTYAPHPAPVLGLIQ